MSTPVAVDALQPVQAALYARMTGDATLLDMLGSRDGSRPLLGVYDDVPQGAPYPRVELGEVIETPRNAHREFGSEIVVTLHVWVQERGTKTAQKIVGRLRSLFDHQPLQVAGHSVVSVRHEQTLTLRGNSPELRHLPVRFRITTEQE